MLAADSVEAIERGRLITIEGIDGAGKTTLARGLRGGAARSRRRRSRSCASRAASRPPSGSASSSRTPTLVIGARAEALLYAAARAQLVDEALEPLLERGTWVLLDRFVDSSLAYQGGGRELGVEAVREINEFGTGGLTPDRTLLLVIDPTLGRARSIARGEPTRSARARARRVLTRGSRRSTRNSPTPSPNGSGRLDAVPAPKTTSSRAALAALDDLL